MNYTSFWPDLIWINSVSSRPRPQQSFDTEIKFQSTIGSYVSCTFIEIWSKKLELLSATPRATLTHLSCSPNFLRASYLDERTVDVWTNCLITFSTRWKIFFSRGICLLTSWACTIGIWSTLAQLNLIWQIYKLCYKPDWYL